jgi:hypothetical protein
MKKNRLMLFTVVLLLNIALQLNTQANQAQQSQNLQQTVAELPAEARAALPNLKLAGMGKLTFFGLEVYEASLWVTDGFKPNSFEDHAFAFELHYSRNFTSEAIAKRSIDEMKRLESLDDKQAEQWQASLREVIPNVKKGDRLVGLYRPNNGVAFWNNGKRTGNISDAEFSRQFFGIWLSPKTSQPKLRLALLGKTGNMP